MNAPDDDEGNTLLHYAVAAGDLDSVKALIEHGAKVDATNTRRQTPLHVAALVGQARVAEYLLRKGANINARTQGMTPLDLAARQNRVEVVLVLLDQGADIEPGWLRASPLHLAAERGHIEIVRLLLIRGADPKKKSMGRTPAELASRAGHKEVAELLKDAVTGKDPRKPLVFDELNYRFTPPGGDWSVVKDIKSLNAEANFGLMHKSGKLMMIGIGERLGGDFDNDWYLAMAKARMEAKANEMDIVETKDYEVSSLAGKRRITDSVITGNRLRFVQWVRVQNGYAYNLSLWGTANSAAEKRKVVAESDRVFAGFELIDPARVFEGVSGAVQEKIESESLGITADLKGLNWRAGKPQDVGDEDADVALQQGQHSGFVIKVFALLEHDPDVEAIAKAFLHDWSIEYPGPDVTNHRTASEEGSQSLRFNFSRTVEASRYWYSFKVVKTAGHAYMVVAWSARDDDATRSTLDTTVDRVQIRPPQREPKMAEMTEAKRAAIGVFLNTIGLSILEKGQAATARPYFKSFLELMPNNPTALNNYAFTLKEESLHAEANKVLDEHLPKFPDHLGLAALKAAVLVELGDSAEAIQKYDGLFRRGYRDDPALQQYAGLLNAAERREDAIRVLEEYLKKGKSRPVVMTLADLYSQAGKHDQAISLVKDLAASAPGNQQIVCALADAYYAAGQYNEAIREYDGLLSKGQASADIWILKAQVQFELKQYRDAKKSLESALALDQTHREASQFLSRVEGILGRGSNHLVAPDIEPVAMPEWVEGRLKNADSPPPPDAQDAYYVHRVRLVDYRPAEAYRVTEQWLIKVLTTRGVTQFSSFVLDVDPLVEEICINRLIVRDEKGQTLFTGKLDDYFVTDDTTTNQASHDKLLELPVGGLKPGCTIEVVTTRRELGKPEHLTYSALTLTSAAPVSQWIVWVQGGLDGVVHAEANGASVQRVGNALAWEVLNTPAYKWESLQPPWHEFLPAIWIGQRGSWTKEADDYLGRLADRFKLDKITEDTATRLVRDSTDPESRVLNLVKFVQGEFTYRALEFGTRGVIPNDSSRTIANRYGDCKDVSLLLHQLLKAAGVESRLALVNAGQDPVEAITDLDQFNHMIVYVPSFRGGWFFDCTDKDYNPAVSSPPMLAGDMALVLVPGSAEFMRIPDHGMTRDELTVDKTIQLVGDVLDFEETIKFQGIRKLTLDEILAAWPEKDRLEYLGSLLEIDRQGVDLKEYRITRPAKTGDPLVVWIKGQAKGYFHQAGDQVIGRVPALWEGCYLKPARAEKRTTPFRFERPLVVRSSTSFKLPEGRTLANAEDWARCNDSSDFGRWRVEGKRDEQGNLRVDFEHETPKGRFAPERYRDFEQWRNRGLDALSRPVILKKN